MSQTLPSLLKIENQMIRESVFYRLILVIGMRSEIIGRLAPRSSIYRTKIIERYRHHW
jgi:hypothetical protein